MNVEQPLEGGTILYQKPTPKQDKEGGINPAFDSRALRPSKQRSGAAKFAAPPIAFFVRCSLSTSGKPAFLVYSTGYAENFSLARGYYYDGYRAAT